MSGVDVQSAVNRDQGIYLDFSSNTEANEEKPVSSDEVGQVNKVLFGSIASEKTITFDFSKLIEQVPDERGNILRVPSQESMASTDTYQSNTPSMVHVRPATQPGTSAEPNDDDDDDLWEDEGNLEKSMPSHQFRSIRGLPSENALKQGVQRTLKKRVNKSRGSIRSQMSHDATDDASSVCEDDVMRDMDLTAEEFAE
ncbi:hypothetical protein OS493_003036 [Desmophyllum pertusum]|uniref:Uncharacterized protein n=1 Tax=Desmophyllum pertusum TaxID=174260 RepID=A0A9W9YHY3_9CNID|nr:hypothetical protein OS493_003036 [Desmophyllum pertusum]